jgi:hypothetical protein
MNSRISSIYSKRGRRVLKNVTQIRNISNDQEKIILAPLSLAAENPLGLAELGTYRPEQAAASISPLSGGISAMRQMKEVNQYLDKIYTKFQDR